MPRLCISIPDVGRGCHAGRYPINQTGEYARASVEPCEQAISVGNALQHFHRSTHILVHTHVIVLTHTGIVGALVGFFFWSQNMLITPLISRRTSTDSLCLFICFDVNDIVVAVQASLPSKGKHKMRVAKENKSNITAKQMRKLIQAAEKQAVRAFAQQQQQILDVKTAIQSYAIRDDVIEESPDWA